MKNHALLGSIVVSLLLPCAAAGGQGKKCSDPLPEICTESKFLGEVNGCACFECNPETEKAKIVCTSDEDTKARLFELKPSANVAEDATKIADRSQL